MITSLICAATIWINMTNLDWNDHDKKVYKRAVLVCGTDVRYSNTPCVKTFTKTNELSFQVLCGRKK
mgnify:CR=1 FL=1